MSRGSARGRRASSMSHVTNLILTCSVLEEDDEDRCPPVDEINRLICKHLGYDGVLDCFCPVHQAAGGDKAMETLVFLAAIGRDWLDDIAEYIAEVDWKSRDAVQLFVCRQDEDRYSELALTL